MIRPPGTAVPGRPMRAERRIRPAGTADTLKAALFWDTFTGARPTAPRRMSSVAGAWEGEGIFDQVVVDLQ